MKDQGGADREKMRINYGTQCLDRWKMVVQTWCVIAHQVANTCTSKQQKQGCFTTEQLLTNSRMGGCRIWNVIVGLK